MNRSGPGAPARSSAYLSDLSNGETRRQLADGVVTRECPTCGGTGGLGWNGRYTCQTCAGTGELVIRAPVLNPWGGKDHDPPR